MGDDGNGEIEEKPPTKNPDANRTQTVFTYINSCDKLNLVSFVIVLISISTILVIGVDECRRCFDQQPKVAEIRIAPPRKTFWTYGGGGEKGNLKHVHRVLYRMGYRFEPNASDWDLLWAHSYPFRSLKEKLSNLKPHQKVNHFPGCGFITEKVNLSTSGLKYMPHAFKLPRDKVKLLEFSQKNPDAKYVVKNNSHRNVTFRALTDVDLDSNVTFVQEFIQRPLLVGGHMFDIGVYTIVTSIDPLRVYVYNGDYLLRFCPEKYHPFDPNVLGKYVVDMSYKPTWKIPGLEYYFDELGMGMRDTLFAYLKKNGKDVSVIWKQIEDAIRTVFLAKEPDILNQTIKTFGSTGNFFEMMRFDFMINEDLDVFLMEANMSPNLSSDSFAPNRLLYEQVIYNLFSLVGIGERVQKDSLEGSDVDDERMQSDEKNIGVMPTECETKCKHTCEPLECSLCKPCMSDDIKQMLLRAHREHLNVGDCKRIIPPEMNKNENLLEEYTTYTPKNQLMYRWFKEKCEMDPTWCN